MKAIELKINNWVTINDPNWANLKGLPFKVIGINPLLESNKPSDDYVITVCDFYGTYKIYNEFIEGILITPEILTYNIGFNVKQTKWRTLYNYGKISLDKTLYGKTSFSYCFSRHGIIGINYVHQLQILYSALTGEELNIQL